MPAPIPSVRLPSGLELPVLGQGTWYMGEDRRERTREVEALRSGIDLGMNLIDTAEMYADGGAEQVVGEAVKGQREDVLLVSKVMPTNASRQGTILACERSLERLQTDRIDLYLLHWRGRFALEETIAAFEDLVQAGKIRNWGVSNFDTDDMEELVALVKGRAVAANQVLYNLQRRGPEFDLLPWCRERNVALMAYSPIEQGRLLKHPVIAGIAREWQTTPAVIGLAWVLSQSGVIAIPKSSNPVHIAENRTAVDIKFTPVQMDLLNAAFKRPERKVPLAML
ncbi:MAG: aldo/keto reductase [Phyllobacterium sp.]